jgi:hypothetical protein
MLAQERQKTLAFRPATQPSKGLQHGEIGFASPILFDALPATDPQRPCATYAFDEGLHQGGFANTSLPRHEADLPRAPQGLCQPLLHLDALRLPTHEQARTQHGKWRSDT